VKIRRRDGFGLARRERRGDAGGMRSRTLRIISYNTWKNEGPYADRLAAMSAGLGRLDPDVVLLQECFRTPGGEADTAAALAASLGMACGYAAARRARRRWRGRDVDSESGLAVLVRGAIEAQDRWPLPTCEAGGERVAVLVRARVADGAEIIAGSFHLSHLRGDEEGRRAQFEAVLAHPWWRTPQVLRVAGGDANTTTEGEALNWAAAHSELRIADVFAGQEREPTHPLPSRPDRRGRPIDQLFLVATRGEMPGRRIGGGVALAEPEAGIWPSDHAAVWADVVGGEGVS
jgi:endonuclease/exonuclease/phosphatase family metal-dependent hydrolase